SAGASVHAAPGGQGLPVSWLLPGGPSGGPSSLVGWASVKVGATLGTDIVDRTGTRVRRSTTAGCSAGAGSEKIGAALGRFRQSVIFTRGPTSSSTAQTPRVASASSTTACTAMDTLTA